jgi:hypothetical protein
MDSVTRVLLQMFSWVIYSQAPKNNIKVTSNFSKMHGDIRVRKSRCNTVLMGYRLKGNWFKKKPEVENISWHCPFNYFPLGACTRHSLSTDPWSWTSCITGSLIFAHIVILGLRALQKYEHRKSESNKNSLCWSWSDIQKRTSVLMKKLVWICRLLKPDKSQVHTALKILLLQSILQTHSYTYFSAEFTEMFATRTQFMCNDHA